MNSKKSMKGNSEGWLEVNPKNATSAFATKCNTFLVISSNNLSSAMITMASIILDLRMIVGIIPFGEHFMYTYEIAIVPKLEAFYLPIYFLRQTFGLVQQCVGQQNGKW